MNGWAFSSRYRAFERNVKKIRIWHCFKSAFKSICTCNNVKETKHNIFELL